MKLKYYLRGLGIGIIVTTIVLMVSFSKNQKTMTDDEVIERALQLGMIMPENEVGEMEPVETEMNAEDLLASVTSERARENAGDTEDSQNPGEQNPEDAGTPEGEQNPGDAGTPEGEQNPEDAGTPEGSYHLTIRRGDVCRTVCETLAANGVTPDAEALRKYLFEIGYASSISTGEYDIPYGSSMEEIAAVLKAGPIQ